MRDAPHRTRRGFTLVELLAVVSIIVILLGLGVGVTRYASLRAETNRARADLQRIATALEEYRVQYGAYPDPSNTSWNRMATDRRGDAGERTQVAQQGQQWRPPFDPNGYPSPKREFMERLMEGLPKSDPWGAGEGQSYEYRRTSRYSFDLRSVGPSSDPNTTRDNVTLRD